MKIDYRSRAGREAEVLAEIQISRSLSRKWLNAVPQRRAAWFRLLADGVVKQHRHRLLDGDDVVIAEIVEQEPKPSLWQSMTQCLRAVL